MSERDNPDPVRDGQPNLPTDPVAHAIESEKDNINRQAETIPSGVPYPTVMAPVTPDPLPATSPDDIVPRTSNEKPHSSSSSGASTVAEKKKPFSFGRKKKQREAEEKKAKEKEKEAEQLKPVGLFQLFRFAKPHEKILNIFGLILAAASGAAQPLMTLIFGRLTNDFTNYAKYANQVAAGGGNANSAALLEQAKQELKTSAGHNALYLLALGIGMFLTTWAYMFIWTWSGEVNAKRIREKYLHATLRQDIAYFDDLGAGEVATRIQSDCLLVQEGTSERVAISVTFLSTFLTGFILAIARGWRLALVCSCILPFIMMCGITMQVLMRKWLGQTLEDSGKAGGIAEEVISSIRTIHAFGTSRELQGKFNKHIDHLRYAGKKSTTGETFGLGAIFFVVYATYGLAFWYGAILVYQGRANVGVVINVFMSILIGSFSLAMLAPEVQAIGKACSAAAKLFSTIDRVPPIDSADPGGLKPDVVHGTISFENVKFHYPSRPNVPILKGLTTSFPAGHTVALVGASGSGKSTVISLVERFYDPIEGCVKLDGVNIKDLNLKWLRQQIGLVSQEPTLFGDTVRGNVEHGLIGSKYEFASDAEKFELVKKACIDANAHDFILKLPKGYDTHVGERGMLLSGGQKQRVAIARAIVSDPRILLLDEATSALDTQSEGIVQDALDKAAKGRTTITIAHRLSTIRDADVILVMGGGEILEQGNHDSLLANENGPYAQLVATQALNTAVQEGQKVEDPDEPFKAPIESPTGEKGPGLMRAITGRSLASVAMAKAKAEEAAESERNKPKFKWSFYLRLLKINKEEKWLYIIGTLGAMASGMVYPALSILFGAALTDFQIVDLGELKAQLQRKALWYFISAIFSAIAIGVQINGFSRTGWELTAKLRKMQFAAVIRHDISWFDEEKNSTGSVTAGLSEQPQRIQGLFGVTMGSIIQSLTTLLGGCIIGLCYGPLLALVGIACIPLLVSSGYIRLRVVVLKDQKLKDVHAESAQLASEAASAVRTVASLTREDEMDRIYADALKEPMRKSIRGSFKSQALYAASQGMSFLIIALVFYIGALWIISGRYTTSQFFTVLTAVIFASIQAGNVFNFVPDASKTNVAAAEIFRLLDNKPVVDPLSQEGIHLDPEKVIGHIRMEGIHFRYPTRPDIRVLRDLTLDVPAGTYVALVGPSGCGKSTTIQLLERFYDPLIGRVTLDGVDLRDLNVASFRSNMALVSQEPTLYAGSVRFNILIGSNKPIAEVTEDEIITACKDANIYDFIMSLPDGFDTEVGGKGSQLSGGQKQRIAIARALIRNPKVLLLDEATSALDSQSERVVQDALDKASRGRTTIAIAHRLSTIQKADIIYCFSEGKVAEKGTHAELLAMKGAYYELVQMQNLSRQN